MRRLQLLLPVGLCCLAACGPDPGEIGWISQSLGAYCNVNVTGVGVKQVESDYLPHVVACENGGADTEALKAQAVAARTYLYYKLNNSGDGSICDGQSCQVYSCSAQPQQKHYDAVKATAGQVLVWSNVVICSFFVAGAKPSTASCQALSSDPDPTNTEKYVTYNEGKTGSAVTQSSLGWVSPSNKYNRGCNSQNGANCLSKNGKKYPEILRFYYGADIQLVTAVGSCVNPPPDQGTPPQQDQGLPPQQDQGLPPQQDQGLPPQQDQGLPRDGGAQPFGDGLPPMADRGVGPALSLEGGCAVIPGRGASPAGLGLLLLGAALALATRRRR